jgi:hydroxyethylthiazole kinase-like sugar kinase family protein
MTMGHTELLDAWQPAVIKGNAAEIGALADSNEVCPHENQRQPVHVH